MAERVVAVSLIARINSYLSDMDRVAKKNREIGDSADQASERFEKQNQAMERVGGTLMAGGAIATAATALAVKAAIDWETAWAGVTKTVDGTPAQLAEIEQGLRDLAKELPATHTEIAAVAEAAGQLGVAREDIVAFTRTMIELGETTNLTSDEAATSIAQLMNVMQTAPEDVDNLGAALVALGNDGASTEREIIQMAQRLAGAGKLIGASEADILAMANAMASVGISAELGGGAMSRVLQDIYAALAEGGEKAAAFAAVAGKSAEEFGRSFKDDPISALNDFIQGLNGVEASGGNVIGTLSDLGIRSTEEVSTLLRLKGASDLLSDSLELGAQAWEENTALQDEAEKRFATTESQLKILGNTVNDAAINFGTVFLPAINAAADAIGGLADFLGGLPPELQAVIAVTTGLVGVTGLLGGAVLLAIPKIVEFRLALATLGITGGTTRATLSGIASFLTGPWGIALAAGAAGVAVLSNVMASLKATSSELENSIRTASSATELFAVLGQGRDAAWLRDIRADLEDLPGVLAAAAAQSENFWERFNPVGETGTAAFGAINSLRDLGEELGSIATTDLPAAQAAFRMLSDEYKLSERDQWRLLSSMPALKDALVEQAAAQNINVTSTDELANKQRLLELAVGDVAPAVQKNVEVLASLQGAAIDTEGDIEELAETIRGFGSAELDARSAARQLEQAYRDLAESVDANGTSLDIATQAGSNNEAALDGIARAALDSAAAVAIQTGSQDAANATLATARQRLIEMLSQFGITGGAADEYANKLGLIPDNIATFVDLQTGAAEAEMQRFVRTWDGRQINVSLSTPNQAFVMQNLMRPNAKGGDYPYKAFANGGNAHGIYPGGRPLYKFAEYETGFETLISGKRGYERQNLGYAVETIRRLGHQNPAAARDVLGTPSGAAGGQFTGQLYLDSGELLGIVRGEIGQYDQGRSREARRGERV